MSGIDPTQRLLAQIRSTLSSRIERGRDSKRSSNTRQAGGPKLADDLRVLVKGLDFASEEGRKRGRRSFVELVLLDEFGFALADDPKFAAIVEKVDEAISLELALCNELDFALERIQAQDA